MPKVAEAPAAVKAPAKSKAKATPAKTKAKTKTKAKGIVHPEPSVELMYGDSPITADYARELLGWSVLPDTAEDDAILDMEGNKIACLNNDKNRPIYKTTVLTLQQEILRKRWKFNGEPIIIGQRGTILNGQHTLLSLIFAAQAYAAEPDLYEWKEEPTIEKTIVFGVEEADVVVNTMDTCKPRSLTDVIYRADYFSAFKPAERKLAARLANYAVSMIWDRTGVSTEEDAPRRTHAESIAFLDAHPNLLECVKHIIASNVNNAIGKYVSPGYASGLMYLMSAAKTDSAEYVQVREESAVDLSLFNLAADFWATLANPKSKEFAHFRSTYLAMAAEGNTSIPERIGIIVKAWSRYADGKTIRASDLELLYSLNEDGERVLSETPEIGGIDVLHIENVVVEGDEVEEVEAVEEETADEKRVATLKGKANKNRAAKSVEPTFEVGEKVWVYDAEAGNWEGNLVEKLKAPHGWVARVKAAKGYEGAGEVYETKLTNLHKTQPAAAA